jgi:hypothetical protein
MPADNTVPSPKGRMEKALEDPRGFQRGIVEQAEAISTPQKFTTPPASVSAPDLGEAIRKHRGGQ